MTSADDKSKRFGDEWRTPLEFYQGLNRRFRFQLDAACTTANCLAPRGLHADVGFDALMEPWRPGPVWVNPPYSNVRPWLERGVLYNEHTVVVLVPADTSVRWWHDIVARYASEVLFVVGRLRFLSPAGEVVTTTNGGGGKTTPSAVVVFAPGRTATAYGYVDRHGRVLQ